MASSTDPPLSYKVWSVDKQVRKGVVAANFSDLEAKCRQKFDGYVAGDQPLRLVLDSDGTEVDQDYLTVVEAGSVLILLRPGEEWKPQLQSTIAVHQPSTAMQPYTTAAPVYQQQVNYQPVPARICPNCGAQVEKNYTCLGILLAAMFFPLGILLCIWMREWGCNNCGRKWTNADYYSQLHPATAVQPYTAGAAANPDQVYSMQLVPARKCPGCGSAFLLCMCGWIWVHLLITLQFYIMKNKTEVKKLYTGLGVLLAVLFFPLGILFCLLLKEWRCHNCERKWSDIDYYNQCQKDMEMKYAENV